MKLKVSKFEKGSQKAFVAMFFVLILVIVLFLGFVKDMLFSDLKKDAQSLSNILKIENSDGVLVDVVLNEKVFKVKVARSKESRERGLAGIKRLTKFDGMVFVFDRPDIYTFWNKDLFIPLDIIWVNNDKVVEVFEGLPAYKGKDPFYVTPKNKADFVFEFPAGFVKKYKVSLGDEILIK